MPHLQSAGSITPTVSALDDNPFRALIRTFGLLERVMNPYFARFGISGAQWGVLRSLYRAQQQGHDSINVTALSQQLLIRPPSVTGVVDRLVRQELVTREAKATDMRVRHIGLTSKGRELVERVLQVHGEQIAKVLSGLDAAEQMQMHQLLNKLEVHLHELIQSTDA
jgi:DNA-binding MarR family transcriptional regulator